MSKKIGFQQRQSPFDRHRETVFGHDATAEWLRRLVLSLWNGDGYPIGLSRIQELDDEHFEVAIEMLTSYRLHGERDPDFMALADTCRELDKAALAASERQARWDVWRRDAERASRQQGGRLGFVEDHDGWFETHFELGMSAHDAAVLASTLDLDSGPVSQYP